MEVKTLSVSLTSKHTSIPKNALDASTNSHDVLFESKSVFSRLSLLGYTTNNVSATYGIAPTSSNNHNVKVFTVWKLYVTCQFL